MKALGFREHGDIEQMQILEVPRPEPGPGEALVEIKASALNHLDIWVCQGWPGLNLALPHISGSDGAGVVAALGPGVSGVEVGDRVAIDPGLNKFEDEYTDRGEHSLSPGYMILGEHVPGTGAEYAVVPAKNLFPLPDHIPFPEAAAVGLVYLTAWRMLMHRANLQAGHSVLIIGAGGGVNSASIQLAKLAGCTVYATTSTAEKMRRARDLGADEVINYRDDPQWSKTLYKMTNKRGVDVVVDNVGQATLADSLRVVARGGKIVIVGNTSGPKAQIDTRFIFGKQISIIGSTMGNHDDYRQVMNLVLQGKLKPVIDRVWPLEKGVEAVRAMARGEQFGKIVLTPS
ncbi:MAG: zinc-binding dehydrogenase [Anaerolineae bacterium]